ncbi:MAG: terminase [Candidatus Liberibacter europaeus]|uniref:Terminase n=1 Tax=Candidatus Liberibacter europaeus TaxID=744859 RepID=A0A2T4VWC6_9HYPH|nr:terminase [Candidatus Liberibacter europaeus]PTL86079.1 MAG: terminase [Candidatus Liberibacter europaeus]
MSRELPTNPETEQKLFALMLSPEIKLSVTNFVTHFFRWKEVGTPLEHFDAPRPWQLDIMNDVDIHCLGNVNNPKPKIFKAAISAGRGIGKTTLNAWMMLWLISTRPGMSIICLANSETQLKSTLWAEVSKWLAMMPNRHWFEMQSLSLHPAPWYADLLKTKLGIDSRHYYIMGRTYSEENPGAIVGNHNSIGYALIVDESSDTPESITIRFPGNFTEINANRFWIMTSNPRRLTGLFYDIFNKPLEEWKRYQIDTRTVEGIDPSFYEEIIARHGINSDIVKVDVLGQFPNQETNSFIPLDRIEEAINRQVAPDPYAPLIMGCDLAEMGGDNTVVVLRRGLVVEHIFEWSHTEADETAHKLIDIIRKHRPDSVVVDINGIGGTVYYILSKYKDNNSDYYFLLFDEKGQRNAKDKELYRNSRAELTAHTADWMILGSIPDHPLLKRDLRSLEAFIEPNTGRLAIGDKRAKGKKSTDYSDALSYTFGGYEPARKDSYLYSMGEVYEYEGHDTGLNIKAYA